MSDRKWVLGPHANIENHKDIYAGQKKGQQRKGSLGYPLSTAALRQLPGPGSLPAAPGRCRRSSRLVLACCCFDRPPGPDWTAAGEPHHRIHISGSLCPHCRERFLKRGLWDNRISNTRTRLPEGPPLWRSLRAAGWSTPSKSFICMFKVACASDAHPGLSLQTCRMGLKVWVYLLTTKPAAFCVAAFVVKTNTCSETEVFWTWSDKDQCFAQGRDLIISFTCIKQTQT